MASSSEDSDIEFSTPSKKLRSAISKCQTMTATDVQPSSSATLRKNLIKATHGNLKKNLRSAESGDRKEIEDSLRELVQDSAEFHKKFQWNLLPSNINITDLSFSVLFGMLLCVSSSAFYYNLC